MPCDMEVNIIIPKVEVFFSEVVELISALSLMADYKYHDFAKDWALSVKKTFCKSEEDTLDKIANLILQGGELLEFVLTWKSFSNVEGFIESIENCEEVEFVSTFLYSEFSLDTIKSLKKDKNRFDKFKEENSWLITPENEPVLEYITYETESFKKELAAVLRKINSEPLREQINNNSALYEEVIKSTKGMIKDRKPLDLAQEIMGKKFRRVSQYTNYYFVPSYFISPHKIRVFDNKELLLVFDARNDNTYTTKRGDEVSNALKVVSDRVRLDILRQLIIAPTYGKVLAARLDLTTATISHHLEQLKNLNLIKEEKVKNIKYFSANMEEVDKLLSKFKEYLYGVRKFK